MATSSDYASAKLDRQTYAEISLIAVAQGRTIKDLVTEVWDAYKAAHPDVVRTIAAVQPTPRKHKAREKQRESRKRSRARKEQLGDAS